MIDIKVKKLNEKATIPTKGSEYAAGWDLYACIDNPVVVRAGETVKIPSGLAFEIPIGYAGFVLARSGLATKKGLAPANKIGLCDCDYRGDYTVALHNHSSKDAMVEPNERIAQVVFLPYLEANLVLSDELSDTERGANGFGSTGSK
jgi:dUTP pyrophosphatase